jgi:hypothetical protein
MESTGDDQMVGTKTVRERYNNACSRTDDMDQRPRAGLSEADDDQRSALLAAR